MPHHPRGYALPLVMGLVLMLAIALSTALFGVAGAVNIGESAVHRRQVYHQSEGVALAAIELTAQRLRGEPIAPALPPGDPAYGAALTALMDEQRGLANDFIAENAGSFTTDTYKVHKAEILSLQPSSPQIIPTGSFAGMQAQVQPFTVQVVTERVHDRSPATQVVQAQVNRATISMFQFYVFSDVYLDLDPGGGVATSGRIHTNGDFCVAGQPSIDRVTAAGRVLISNKGHGLCRRVATESSNIRIYTDETLTSTQQLTKDHTDSDWFSYANNTLQGRAQDSAHKVGQLKMPISGLPRVQAGVNVLAMERSSGNNAEMHPIAQAKEDNTTSMRFLVDPMLQDEPNDVRIQKFAFKADIRIIDGVWFLRDPINPTDVGIPIWSDHPGRLAVDDHPDRYVGLGSTTRSDGIITAKLVGIDDIRGDQGWSSDGPQHYSYYGTRQSPSDPDEVISSRVSGAKRAVISYGLLKTSIPGINEPAFYRNNDPNSLDFASSTIEHLRGTLSGFKNGWLEARSESDNPDANEGNSDVETKRSRLLPVNFDVAAFINALKAECGNNELGSYFPGSCGTGGSGRTFNGVVYITSTWPGMMDGLGDTPSTSDFATMWPFMPANKDDKLRNEHLPMPLCRGESGRPRFDADGVDVELTRCRDLNRGGSDRNIYPNIVRVINAQHISPRNSVTNASVTVPRDALPTGLTIATNLPIAVSGDANIDTTPKRRRFEEPANDRFVPFLIAGDRFHRHSNGWKDNAANWKSTMKATASQRQARSTTQHMEILAGWNPTPLTPLSGHNHSSDGFEDFPRYNERWSCATSPATATYYGSIVVAFASVFEHTGANNDSGHGTSSDFTTCFPRREEGFDFHLEDPLNQPPGTPLILAQSVSSWSTR